MKKLIYALGMLCFVGLGNFAAAQSAEEVINKYFEVTGGIDNWKALKSIKMEGTAKAQGMDLEISSYQKAPNLMKMSMNFQGKDIVLSCFDGSESWKTNFMNMKAEKGEAEDSENMAKEKDFPDALIDYKKKGYTATLEGEETIEGAVCSKLKLTKLPMIVDGKEVANEMYYFFDKENGVIIMQRATAQKGPAKGTVSETFMSDYQEAGGIYYPYSITQKVNGQPVFSMAVKKMEANVEIDSSVFAFPK